MVTITELQERANELCEKKGHKLKWKFEQLAGGKAWIGYCDGCWFYARIQGKSERYWRPLIGTIFKDFSEEVKPCAGALAKAIYRRQYTWQKKAILKAYGKGGIETAIIEAIGDRP